MIAFYALVRRAKKNTTLFDLKDLYINCFLCLVIVLTEVSHHRHRRNILLSRKKMSPESHSLPQPEGLDFHNRIQAKRSLRIASHSLRLPVRQDF
jgi:hypothetical protein